MNESATTFRDRRHVAIFVGVSETRGPLHLIARSLRPFYFSGAANAVLPYDCPMETIAAGRIAFWEGGSLWVFDVPGAAEAPRRTEMHAHHAFQLTISLGGSFNFNVEDSLIPGPFAIVAPDTLHAFEARGLVSHLFVEPESRTGRTLVQLMQGRPAATLTAAQAQDSPRLILEAFQHPRDPRGALRDAGKKISDRIAGHARVVEPDRRVRQIIKWAIDNLDSPLGIDQAARGVGLSPSRASHLFVEETGLPFRTYVLWLRLVCAVEARLAGRTLTEAAQEAGFSDSAHLSRTFKRMFGLPAAALEMS
ncbi:MAG: AraC family transcriptional regulator [Hyphomonas sp.]|nr:AraC family transcriptional regulator [Hyphomonas sp.]